MSQHQSRKPVGADLIIPITAAAYAIYYVWSVRTFPFEAQFSGLALAGLVGLLTLIYFARVARGLPKGAIGSASAAFWGPRRGVRAAWPLSA